MPAGRKTESTRLSGNIKKKYTAISTNCRNALIKFFRDSTDQNSKFLAKLGSSWKIYKNSTFSKYTLHNLHGQVLQTHCLTLLLNWSKELSCLMCSGRRDHNCGDL